MCNVVPILSVKGPLSFTWTRNVTNCYSCSLGYSFSIANNSEWFDYDISCTAVQTVRYNFRTKQEIFLCKIGLHVHVVQLDTKKSCI